MEKITKLRSIDGVRRGAVTQTQIVLLWILIKLRFGKSGDQFLKQFYRCQETFIGLIVNLRVELSDAQGELEKIPKSQILRGPDLLKPLPPDTKLFDNVSSDSQSSKLSWPFSDNVYNVEAESKSKAKKLYGKDLYTAFSFSPEFKTAMEQVKREMIKENPDYLKLDSLVAENLEEVKTDVKVSPRRFKYEFPPLPGIDFEVESNGEEEVEDKKKDERDQKKKKIWSDEDDITFDDMSGYWRMLSVVDEFKISPPWYDAYAEGKVHWMQTDPIPPEVLENSRRKCLNWLTKYFEK